MVITNIHRYKKARIKKKNKIKYNERQVHILSIIIFT